MLLARSLRPGGGRSQGIGGSVWGRRRGARLLMEAPCASPSAPSAPAALSSSFGGVGTGASSVGCSAPRTACQERPQGLHRGTHAAGRINCTRGAAGRVLAACIPSGFVQGRCPGRVTRSVAKTTPTTGEGARGGIVEFFITACNGGGGGELVRVPLVPSRTHRLSSPAAQQSSSSAAQQSSSPAVQQLRSSRLASKRTIVFPKHLPPPTVIGLLVGMQ